MVAIDMLLYLRWGLSVEHVRALWNTIPLDPDASSIRWLMLDLIRLTCSGIRPTDREQLQHLRASLIMAEHLRQCDGDHLQAVQGFCLKACGQPGRRSMPATTLAEGLGDIFERMACSKGGVHAVVAYLTVRQMAGACGQARNP